ncbi:hypothetical protein C7212DRAFT_311819, partial [Tuber magnatum]
IVRRVAQPTGDWWIEEKSFFLDLRIGNFSRKKKCRTRVEKREKRKGREETKGKKETPRREWERYTRY